MAKKQEEIKKIEEVIIDADYTDIMEKSYIDYSMSVITDRAVPDIRDGMKPVQRRILYDMFLNGVTSNKPYKKSAKTVGSVMGSFHPHGDSSIYEAAVVMAQPWKKEVPLIDGHGNFGSIEGDGAAASRYTEMRLKPFSEIAILEELKNDTVDFVANYDETTKEPVCLPCKIPSFLVNGSEGIAVGMTTSTPTHNLSDTIDTAIYFLENPKCTTEDLMEVLKGPDFPTGGIVGNKAELNKIYSTGTGKIKLRGKVHFEKGTKGEKDKLVVTEIPYTMIGEGISKFLHDVAGLVEDRVIPDIVDITNQSSKEGIRIVFELKKDADWKNIENILYKKTKLEDTFGVNMLAVHNGRPETMNLLSIMEAFKEFQYSLYTRKFTSLLEKANKKKEVSEGLIKAIDVVDVIIEVLRGSKNVSQAKKCLMVGDITGINFKTKTAEKNAKKLAFSEIQANAIMDMRMARLVGLELETLQKEYDALLKEIARYTRILNSKNELKKEIIKELARIKKEFGVERKTEITDVAEITIKKKEEPDTPSVVLMDRFGYIHVVDKTAYDKNPNTEFKYIIPTSSKSKIAVFTNKGNMYSIKVKEIPLGKVKDKGQPIDNISQYDSSSEDIVGIYDISGKFLFVSSDGFVKVVDASEFDVSRRKIDATKLNDDQTLVAVLQYNEKSQLGIKTKQGYYTRYKMEGIPEKKKAAIGVVGIKMNANDIIESAVAISDLKELAFENVAGERIKVGKRGDKGVKIRI